MSVHGVSASGSFDTDIYPRLFRDLPPLDLDDTVLRQLADELTGVSPRDNPNIPAGYTYFGQFTVHDITFGVPSIADANPAKAASRNLRTPRLELDSLYGDGPIGSPYLYDRRQDGFFLMGSALSPLSGDPTGEIDVPRNEQGTALLGDPRNDDNVVISQLHSTIAATHNNWMIREMRHGSTWTEAFEHVSNLIRWHYQWIVLNDYLPRLVGDDLVRDILPWGAVPAKARYSGRFFSLTGDLAVPAEFAVAAYRVGHSMVRQSYVLNDSVASGSGPVDLFVPGDLAVDLRGGQRLRAGWGIDWRWFLPIDPNVSAQMSQVIGPHLAQALSALPNLTPSNLALRTLRRGQAFGLPSGQDVARAMGEPVIRAGVADPLWLYILREASELNEGIRMGPVGGRIVAEVLIGLLAADPLAYVNLDPEWQPAERERTLGGFLGAAADGAPPDLPGATADFDLGPSWNDLPIPSPGEQGCVEVGVDRDGRRTVRRRMDAQEAPERGNRS